MATLDAAIMIYIAGLLSGILLPLFYPKLFEDFTKESEDDE